MHPDRTADLTIERQPAAGGPARRARLRGLLIAMCCWAVLVTGWCLEPRAIGHGTHEQLGMPPCSFLSTTGYPCAFCGLTTSVSAMAHGRIADAFRANAFGVVLFAVLAAATVVSMTELITARNIARGLRARWWWYVVAAVAGVLAGWGWKVVGGIAAGKLPLR